MMTARPNKVDNETLAKTTYAEMLAYIEMAMELSDLLDPIIDTDAEWVDELRDKHIEAYQALEIAQENIQAAVDKCPGAIIV
jgi:hypothetical protein